MAPNKLQINFRFLAEKHFIWTGKLKECTTKSNDFLSNLNHIFKKKTMVEQFQGDWKLFYQSCNNRPPADPQEPFHKSCKTSWPFNLVALLHHCIIDRYRYFLFFYFIPYLLACSLSIFFFPLFLLISVPVESRSFSDHVI